MGALPGMSSCGRRLTERFNRITNIDRITNINRITNIDRNNHTEERTS